MAESRLLVAPWLRSYDRSWWRPDLVASLTLWAVLVPQAMAYAILAGVPAVYGLYTAMAAMVGYALLGSSRELNQGPESAVAILTASIVGPLAAGDGDRYLALAALLAVLIGMWCLLGGFLRLGFITRYLSRPILLGYILGSAVLIVTSQLEAFFGLSIEDGQNYLSDLGAVIRNLGDTHLPTLLLGLALVGLIYGVRRVAPAVPAYLVAAVVGILAVMVLGLADQGVAVVGEIQQGLPVPRLPDVGFDDVFGLLGPALAVGILAFADSVVTAESIAKTRGYSVDANREFFGLGGASLLSALFQGFPVNGSQTRSVVLADAGARSQMSGVMSAGLVALTLLFLTDLFASLPDVALAAIVIVAGIGLFDIAEYRRIRRIDRADAVLALITATGVLVLGMLAGIVVAIVLSLLDVARRAITPHTAVLGRVPGTDRFRDIEALDQPETVPGLLVYRFDAPLFFANVDRFTDDIRQLIAAADPPIRVVVVDAEAITDVDSTAAADLDGFAEELMAGGVMLWFARTHQEVRSALDEVGLSVRLGTSAYFLEVDGAVDAFVRSRPPEGSEGGLPSP